MKSAVLNDWNPEDSQSWDSKIAWRTLAITTYSMIMAFCVWFLVSAIAPKLNDIGFHLSKEQLYWLTSMPGLSCVLIRLAYMFLPPLVGTRKLVGYSSLLYAIPMLGWFVAVQNPNTSYGVLLGLAFACGIGGGSFSGYMPSTGYFFPKRLQGTALGIQAGIGNLGMSIIQLVGPLLMGFGLFGMTWVAPQAGANGPIHVHNAAIFFVPWTIVAAILAFTLLKDVPVKANIRQQLDIFSNSNTWVMTAMYVMTFGIFSGFAAQFALIINQHYGKDSAFAGMEGLPAGAGYAFLGPLIGSLVGWAALFLEPKDLGQFPVFLTAMLLMFFFSGIGNAGTFKQMPMIMPKRQAGGAIGFTAAVASLGPFIVGVALSSMSASLWFWLCAAYCLACAALCWVRYARPGAPFPG